MERISPKRSRSPFLPELPFIEAITHNETTRLMAFGVLVGFVAGMGAYVFSLVSTGVGTLFLHTTRPCIDTPVWWRMLLVPVGGGLLAGLVITILASDRRLTSIADVIDAVANRRGVLHLKGGALSAFASAICIGTGLSGGREGPIVQFGSSLASWLNRLLKLSPQHARVLVAAGAAGGIAASFNTPIGGAFFALEVILANFGMNCLGPVVAASVTGTVLGQALLGKHVALDLPPFVLQHPAELLIYPVLGILCSLVAVGYKHSVLSALEISDRLPLPRPVLTMFAGLVVGSLALLGFPEIMGNGYPYMEELLRGTPSSLTFLVMLLVVKGLATSVTVGSGSGPGIFAPALFLGAVTGTLFGLGVNGLWPDVTESAGAYGMVGMGAVAAAVTHAPIAMTLMLFEMTGNYAIIPPLILTLVVSGAISTYLDFHSFYQRQLAQRGIRVDRTREELVMHDLQVRDIMRTRGYRTFTPDEPFEKLAECFLHGRVQEVYVVDEARRFHGLVDIQDIKQLLVRPREGVSVADVEMDEPAILHPDMSLADALPIFYRADLEELPVLDDDRYLVGILRERDIVGAYNREILRKDALMARIEHGSGSDRQTDFLELPEGHVMDVVDVTGQLVGHTLQELQLPTRFNVTVVAVSILDPETGRHKRMPARADLEMKEGDRLVVMGPKLNVMELQAEEADTEATEAISREAFERIIRQNGKPDTE